VSELFLLLFNIINFFSIYFFFFHVLIVSFISLENIRLKKLFFFYKFYWNSIIISFFFFYLYKFFFYFYCKMIFFKYFNTFFSISVIGDSVVILVFIILFISLFLLSERSFFVKDFSIFFYFIFVVITIQLTSTNNFLLLVVFFEFLFVPSLYFLHNYGYALKIDKSVDFLLFWLVSSTFFSLIGVLYLYFVFNTLNLLFIFNISESYWEKLVLFILFFVGFGVKVPVWPFYYWLTKVHVEASAGFSVFLSGFLVKTAFFCFVNFFYLFCDVFTYNFSICIIVWGMLDSSFRMWSATDLKRLIAYTTIQEMNLMLLFFVLSVDDKFFFLNIFIIIHGLLSSLLFYIVDIIQKKSFSRNLLSLSGFSVFFPRLSFFVWICILIFRSFPIFIKFIIEWELLFLCFYNYGVYGFCLFFFSFVFSVLGFSRIFCIILYGQPNRNYVKSVDFLKRDWVLGLFIILLFFGLHFIFFFVI
jgi:NADH-quinone oxidoreductase subunit M